MPNTNWSELSHLQLGRYAEYYAKMEFASYGYDVYTSEVDDHGVDFVARNPNDGEYYEIQVKAVRNLDYFISEKIKWCVLLLDWCICCYFQMALCLTVM